MNLFQVPTKISLNMEEYIQLKPAETQSIIILVQDIRAWIYIYIYICLSMLVRNSYSRQIFRNYFTRIYINKSHKNFPSLDWSTWKVVSVYYPHENIVTAKIWMNNNLIKYIEELSMISPITTLHNLWAAHDQLSVIWMTKSLYPQHPSHHRWPPFKVTTSLPFSARFRLLCNSRAVWQYRQEKTQDKSTLINLYMSGSNT